MLSVGFWKTRKGEKAYVAHIAAFNPLASDDKALAFGWIGDQAVSWVLNGQFNLDGSHHDYDLIDQWIEPVKSAQSDVYVVKLLRSDATPTLAVWSVNAGHKLENDTIVLAIARIQFNDGDGMNEYLNEVRDPHASRQSFG